MHERGEVVLVDLQGVGNQALEHLHLLLRHHGAALGIGLDDAEELQLLEGGAHVGTAHVELGGQPAFGGQTLAGLQTTAVEQFLYVFQHGVDLLCCRGRIHFLIITYEFGTTKLVKKPVSPNRFREKIFPKRWPFYEKSLFLVNQSRRNR